MIGKIFHRPALLCILMPIVGVVLSALFNVVMDAEIAVFLGLGISIVGGFVWMWFYLGKEMEYYIFHEGTLTIKKRGIDVSKYISILDEKNYSVSYKPKELHIGAVTTGGFTVGGVYETGGYEYISGSENNGNCYLAYEGAAGNRIFKIVLNNEFVELAKNSNISRFLHGNTISLVKVNAFRAQSAISNLSGAGLSSVSGLASFHNELSKDGFSLAECHMILDWLHSVTK